MKITERLHGYWGFDGRIALAHLRAYDHEGSIVAILGELTDNPSTSITNCAEWIIGTLRAEYFPRDLIVIEYYPDSKITWSTVISPPRTKPVWGPLTQAEVEMLIGEPVEVWDAKNYTITAMRTRGLQ